MKTKKVLALVLAVMLVAVLAGCQSPNPPQKDAGMLEVPGLHWGDSPETVREVLKLTQDNILEDAAIEGAGENWEGWAIVAKDLEIFGAKTASAKFQFGCLPEGKLALEAVTLYYPEEKDLTAVEAAMDGLYGVGTEKAPAQYEIADGKVSPVTKEPVEVTGSDWTLSCRRFWVSSVSGRDYLSTESQEKAVDFFANQVDPTHPYFCKDRDVVLEYIAKQPLVYACTTDGGFLTSALTKDSPYITDCGVYISARQLNFLDQYFG